MSKSRDKKTKIHIATVQKKEPEVLRLPQDEPVLTFTRKTDESKVQ